MDLPAEFLVIRSRIFTCAEAGELWILKFEYPKQVHFQCEKCALCCGDNEEKVRKILLLKTEVSRISDKTSRSVEEYAVKIEGSEPYVYIMRKDGGKCTFLRNNLCTIYEIRPIICRFYPFKLEKLGKNRYTFAYTNECPGIGKGSPLNKVFFEELFTEFLSALLNYSLHCKKQTFDRDF